MRIKKENLKTLIKDLINEDFRTVDGLYPATKDLNLIESMLNEIGLGVGMDPTGATMPQGMERSEYKQLEDAATSSEDVEKAMKYLMEEPEDMVQAFLQELSFFLVEETILAPVSVARDTYDFSEAITNEDSTQMDILAGALGMFPFFGGAIKRLKKFRAACQKIAKNAEKQRDFEAIADLNLLINKQGGGRMGGPDAATFGHLTDEELKMISEESQWMHGLEKAIFETKENLRSLEYVKAAVNPAKLRTRAIRPYGTPTTITASANYLKIDPNAVAKGIGYMRSISKFTKLVKKIDDNTIKNISEKSGEYLLNISHAEDALKSVGKGIVEVADMKALKVFADKVEEAGGIKVFKLPAKRVNENFVIDFDAADISPDVAKLYKGLPKKLQSEQGMVGGEIIMLFPPVPREYIIPEGVTSIDEFKNCIGFFAECLERVKDLGNQSEKVVEIIRQPSMY